MGTTFGSNPRTAIEEIAVVSSNKPTPNNYTEYHLTVMHEYEEDETFVYHSREDVRMKIGLLLSDGYRLEELSLVLKYGVLEYTNECETDIKDIL